MKRNDIIYTVLLFSVGLTLLLVSIYFITKTLETENYIFDLNIVKDDKNITYFNCFNLNYDFSSNYGSMSFVFNNETDFDFIIIEFPKFIKDVRYSIQPDESIVKKIENMDISQIILSNFSQRIEKHNVTFYFKSDISPNAYFQIFSRPENLVIWAGCGPAINFKLTDKYNCIGRCFIPLNGVEEHILSSPNDIKINFKNDKIYDNHRFKIESSQNYTFFLKDEELFFGLGVSFISASLIFLFGCLSRTKTEHL